MGDLARRLLGVKDDGTTDKGNDLDDDLQEDGDDEKRP